MFTTECRMGLNSEV